MHFQLIISISLVIALIATFTESANILGIFNVQSRSHHSINQPILRGLAAKGHNVTIISHFKSNDTIPNYTEILLPTGTKHYIDSVTIEESVQYSGLINFIAFITELEKSSCDRVFSSNYIKQLINSKSKCEKIDLIIVEIYFTHCYHLLAHKLDVPVVLISPPSLSSGLDYFLGNPHNPSITPLVVSRFTTKMNFWQRLVNSFQYAVLYWHQVYKFNENMAEYAREVFNMELSSDEELNRRTALAFYNNHASFMARPKSPNAINIAGIHMKQLKKLPKDLEEFIEGSPQGVILFSFGSSIKASSISPEKINAFKDAFASIPQRILWRVDKINITDVPNNVKLSNWLPQLDILEHKNVIAFISHCGIFGTLEAIYTGTPVIGIPIMFDQFQDANILVEKEAGVYIDYHTMDKNTLLGAINEVVTNSKYRENMQKLSTIFKDRPMSPLDEALYWTEYVLKHKGAPQLRTAAADMPLYRYLLLDVILSILCIVIAFFFFLRYIFKIILILCHQKREKNKTQ